MVLASTDHSTIGEPWKSPSTAHVFLEDHWLMQIRVLILNGINTLVMLLNSDKCFLAWTLEAKAVKASLVVYYWNFQLEYTYAFPILCVLPKAVRSNRSFVAVWCVLRHARKSGLSVDLRWLCLEVPRKLFPSWSGNGVRGGKDRVNFRRVAYWKSDAWSLSPRA